MMTGQNSVQNGQRRCGAFIIFILKKRKFFSSQLIDRIGLYDLITRKTRTSRIIYRRSFNPRILFISYGHRKRLISPRRIRTDRRGGLLPMHFKTPRLARTVLRLLLKIPRRAPTARFIGGNHNFTLYPPVSDRIKIAAQSHAGASRRFYRRIPNRAVVVANGAIHSAYALPCYGVDVVG